MGNNWKIVIALALCPVLLAAASPPADVPVPIPRPPTMPVPEERPDTPDEAGKAAPATGATDSRVPVPLPAPRPDPQEANAEPDAPAPLTAQEVTCLADLVELEVAFKAVDPVEGEGQCGIDHPIEVSGLSSGITLDPPGVMTCAAALSLENWTRESVAPAARRIFFEEIDTIRNYSTYVCRTRNSQPDARISEHARGNAVDVGQFVLENGRVIDVRSPPLLEILEWGFLHVIRRDACDFFKTVLGPGTDEFHDNHFHLDMSQRSSGFVLCSLWVDWAGTDG